MRGAKLCPAKRFEKRCTARPPFPKKQCRADALLTAPPAPLTIKGRGIPLPRPFFSAALAEQASIFLLPSACAKGNIRADPDCP